MKKPNNKIRGVKAWAGVVDDGIGSGWMDWGSKIVDVLDIFRTKTEAEQHFKQVIPVLITPLPKRKPLKTK